MSARSRSRRGRFLSIGLSLGLSVGALAACDPQPPAKEFWRPWYELHEDDPGTVTPPPDLGGGRSDSGSGGPADLKPIPGGCTLAVSVTTASAGGKYAPRNIGAIWISDDADRFVKTLAVWADKRVKYLKRWNEVTTAAGKPASRVDAVSSATKTSHGVRTGTWNCTNASSMPVADGAYKVCFELTDYDGQGPYNCVPFTKSPAPFSATPADSPSFTARRLEMTQ